MMVLKSLIPPGRKKVVRKAVSDGDKRFFGGRTRDSTKFKGRDPEQEGMIPKKPAVKKRVQQPVQPTNEELTEQLFYFAKLKDWRKLRALIESGADVNAQDEDGYTLLHYGVVRRNIEFVKFLIEKNIRLDIKDNKGFIAFHYTCFYRESETVEVLIEAGVNVNEVGTHNRNSLHLVCETAYGKKEHGRKIVRLLLEKGAKVNALSDSGKTALHSACTRTDAEIVKMLSENGANVNATDGDGETALHRCYQHEEMVKILVENGADINSKDKEGKTVLCRACELYDCEDNRKIVEFLKRLGAE